MLFDIAGGIRSVEDGAKQCLDSILDSDLVQTPWHDWFCISSGMTTPQPTPGLLFIYISEALLLSHPAFPVIAPSTTITRQLAPPPTPISPVDSANRRGNQIAETQRSLSPRQVNSRVLTSSPSSPTQGLSSSSLVQAPLLAINNVSGTEQGLPSPSPSLGQDRDRRLESVEFAPLSPSPASPPWRSPSSSSSSPETASDERERNPIAPQLQQNSDMYGAQELSALSSQPAKATKPRTAAARFAPNDGNRKTDTRRPVPPLDEGEHEVSENERGQAPQAEQIRKRKAGPKPKSTNGTKRKRIRPLRKAKYVAKDSSFEGEDAEEDVPDEDIEAPRDKRPRMEIPDQPSDTSLPSVAGIDRPRLRKSSTPSTRSSTPPPIETPFEPAFPRKHATTYTFCNVLNQEETICLAFHDEEQLKWFQSGMDSSRQTAHDGQPLYLAQDSKIRDSSSIRIVTREEFDAKWRHIIGDFQTQHLVITDEDYTEYDFDAHGLDTVLPPSKTTALMFRDQSPRSPGCDIWPTPEMIISAQNEQTECGQGKMLYYHGPKIDSPGPHHSLATEVYAHRISYATGALDCYSHEYLRWGQASTMAAYLPWDPNQCAGHFESVVCGSRLFFVCRPKDGDGDTSRFLYDPAIFSTHTSESIGSKHWDVEAVVVPAGSDIYIRPFTPYASISLHPSISHGAYFIPCAMIERTIVGIYQNWATTRVTSGLHWAIEHASRAILHLWSEHFVYRSTSRNQHFPDLETLEGVYQLFSLCSYRELVNICCSEAYAEEDFSQGLSVDKRKEFIRAREVSRGLLSWFALNFTFTARNDSQDIIEMIYDRYLVGTVKALLYQAKYHGDGEIPYKKIEQLVRLTFQGDTCFWMTFKSEDVTPSYGGRFDGRITSLPKPKRLCSHNDGTTPEDRVWRDQETE
ncbi:hypothetical protein BDN72DRAFT_904474 [Pluteus cervinus]|uniref:Uncharacterized protein n=1 Tax=Pluteus cervinus TaxID=181527 RepID=A0ACD3A5N7_9AGAR|nr:hypothetical protein BDN72DRAFT_904474 [Pluteus cervinus]